MIPVIVKWVEGAPEVFQSGQLIVYDTGDCDLVGECWTPAVFKIVKHTTLIEQHELDWLKSMAAGRSLGVAK